MFASAAEKQSNKERAQNGCLVVVFVGGGEQNASRCSIFKFLLRSKRVHRPEPPFPLDLYSIVINITNHGRHSPTLSLSPIVCRRGPEPHLQRPVERPTPHRHHRNRGNRPQRRHSPLRTEPQRQQPKPRQRSNGVEADRRGRRKWPLLPLRHHKPPTKGTRTRRGRLAVEVVPRLCPRNRAGRTTRPRRRTMTRARSPPSPSPTNRD